MWKRRKQLLDEVTQLETATPHGSHGLLVEIRELLRHILRASRTIVVTAIILVIVVFALQLQVSSRNENIHQTQVSAEEAKRAAQDAKQAVEDAVRQSQSGNGIDVQKLIEGLNAMTRVEQYVCGGPCPADDITTTTEGN